MDIAKELRLIFYHLDTPVLSQRAARNFLDASLVYTDDDFVKTSRTPGIHPSALCHCMRQAAMEMSSFPRSRVKVPEPVRKAALIGKIIHKQYQAALLQASRSGIFSFRDEVSIHESGVAKQLMLRGLCDGVIGFEGLELGLEIKSLDHSTFCKIRDPLEPHLLQASVYQGCLGLKAMWFIFVSRKTFTDMHRVIHIPDSYWTSMRMRASVVLEHELQDLLPPGTDQLRICTMCAFNPICPDPKNRAVTKKEVWRWARERPTAQTPASG